MPEYGSPSTNVKFTFKFRQSVGSPYTSPETEYAHSVEFTETHVVFKDVKGDVLAAYLASGVIELRRAK